VPRCCCRAVRRRRRVRSENRCVCVVYLTMFSGVIPCLLLSSRIPNELTRGMMVGFDDSTNARCTAGPTGTTFLRALLGYAFWVCVRVFFVYGVILIFSIIRYYIIMRNTLSILVFYIRVQICLICINKRIRFESTSCIYYLECVCACVYTYSLFLVVSAVFTRTELLKI